MNKWDAIKDYVMVRICNRETNLVKLAHDSGVSYWWLNRCRYRQEVVSDPGFTKVGRVFEALGGRAPKVPQTKE